MIEPLHVATVGDHPLRFFRTPLNDGRPDLPWVAIDDLGRCIGLSRRNRKIHLRVFHSLSKDIIRTVATPDGRISIAPHALARAAVEALIDMGRAPTSARDDYVSASAEAMSKLNPEGFPSVEALTAWVNAAANRWQSVGSFSIAELFPFIEKRGEHDA
jgi:hypothetical protein